MDVKLPDGTLVRGVPDNMSKDEFTRIARSKGYNIPDPSGGRPPAPNHDDIEYQTKKDMERLADPTEGMGGIEKAVTGFDAGITQLGRGALSLINKTGMLPKAGKKMLEEMKEDEEIYQKHHPGWEASVGEAVGQGAVTAPIGGAIGQGGKALVKAVPYAAKFAPSAGSWLGLGAQGAAEGAATNVLAGPDDKSVLENAISGAKTGGIANPVLSKTIRGIGHVGRGIAREFFPTSGAAETRATRALERRLEDHGGMEDVAKRLRDPRNTSPIPRTTAAAADSAELGALEHGARGRPNEDFGAHEASIDIAAHGIYRNATREADRLALHEAGPGAVMSDLKEALDKVPFSKANRDIVTAELKDLLNTTEVKGDTTGALSKTINAALEAVGDKGTNLGILAELRTSLRDASKSSTAVKRARDVMGEILENKTAGKKGDYNVAMGGYKNAMDDLKSAQAAQRLRQKFDVEGTPATRNASGSTPNYTDYKIRQALTNEVKQDAGKSKYLDPTMVTELQELAKQLRTRDIHLPAQARGGRAPDMGIVEGATNAAINATPLWRLRGVPNVVLKGQRGRAEKVIDKALINPQEFLRLYDNKVKFNQRIEPWEKAMMETIRGASRSKAIDTEEQE